MSDPPVPCHPKEGPAFAHAVSPMSSLTGVYFPSEEPSFLEHSLEEVINVWGTHGSQESVSPDCSGQCFSALLVI